MRRKWGGCLMRHVVCSWVKSAICAIFISRWRSTAWPSFPTSDKKGKPIPRYIQFPVDRRSNNPVPAPNGGAIRYGCFSSRSIIVGVTVDHPTLRPSHTSHHIITDNNNESPPCSFIKSVGRSSPSPLMSSDEMGQTWPHRTNSSAAGKPVNHSPENKYQRCEKPIVQSISPARLPFGGGKFSGNPLKLSKMGTQYRKNHKGTLFDDR